MNHWLCFKIHIVVHTHRLLKEKKEREKEKKRKEKVKSGSTNTSWQELHFTWHIQCLSFSRVNALRFPSWTWALHKTRCTKIHGPLIRVTSSLLISSRNQQRGELVACLSQQLQWRRLPGNVSRDQGIVKHADKAFSFHKSCNLCLDGQTVSFPTLQWQFDLRTVSPFTSRREDRRRKAFAKSVVDKKFCLRLDSYFWYCTVFSYGEIQPLST